jgi:GDP-L-fucose synthase
MRRLHEGKTRGLAEVEVGGTGTPRRDLLRADDLASACLFLMQEYDGEAIVNVGVGEDLAIRDVAELLRDVVGYRGTLRRGLEETYAWFLDHIEMYPPRLA